MSKKDEHKTKKLLKSVNLDSPSVHFTNKVMSEVRVFDKKEALNDAELTALLYKHDLESPPVNFTSKLMGKINASPETSYQPLISKKVWRIIGVLFAGSVVFTLFSKPTGNFQIPYREKVLASANNWLTGLDFSLQFNQSMTSMLLMSIFCLTILLILDTFLRVKNQVNLR